MNAPGVWFMLARTVSLGIRAVFLVFVVSVLVVLSVRGPSEDAVDMWVFSPEHRALYEQHIEQNIVEDADPPLRVSLMSIEAIQSRILSGVYGGLESADMIEVERAISGPLFLAPDGAVGLRDLRPILEQEGLLDQFNAPSLSPWERGGRLYGVPHDVHPVMLAYRADIVEAAGIDLTEATTWDRFFEMLGPLMRDTDGDGAPDRHPLAFWYTQRHNLELLLLQGGGRLFDDAGRPTLDAAPNPELLARVVSWCLGPDRVVVDIDEFSASGHMARIRGDAIAYLCPDWMCSIWRANTPQLGGKLKLMPLPAFEEGGRRTSVRGGTMLCFPSGSERFDASWEYAMSLYTSPELARELYRTTDIITPVTALWDDPVFDEPDPFFMGQPKGRMYIELAPHVPQRRSSAYYDRAVEAVRDAAVNLVRWSRDAGIDSRGSDRDALTVRARELLGAAQRRIEREMDRRVVPGAGGGS